MSNNNWRLITECRRPISRLRLCVSDDAEIEIRSRDRGIILQRFLRANERLQLGRLQTPLAVLLRSPNPQCQCQIQAEYIEETTTPPSGLDMRFLYGPMGLGIPLNVTGNPFDLSDYPFSREAQLERQQQAIKAIERIRKQEEPEQPKTPPGITRLQAFKRELDEEKPKKKRETQPTFKTKKEG